jgi:hypothetical protein
MTRTSRGSAPILVAIAALTVVAFAAAASYGPWGVAQKLDTIGANSAELNTSSIDGCPIQSPDGLSLYLASNRPGGLGGLDIWVATRSSRSAAWGDPRNLGEPVNSAADDFCPTPVGEKGLFVVRCCRAHAGRVTSTSLTRPQQELGSSPSGSCAHRQDRTALSTSRGRPG